MEIISAHPPHPPLFAFISLLETRLGSSRSGGEGGEATSRRRSPRPARRLHGPGSTAAGRARGAAGPGPGGGRRDRGRSSRATPGRALPPQHTHTHTRTHASAGPCPQRPGRSPRERYAIARTPAPRRRDAATYSSGPPSNRRAAGGGCGSPSSRQRPLPTGGSG